MPEALPRTMAVSDYDHVRDITSGAVRADGIQLTCLNWETLITAFS